MGTFWAVPHSMATEDTEDILAALEGWTVAWGLGGAIVGGGLCGRGHGGDLRGLMIMWMMIVPMFGASERVNGNLGHNVGM